jgi:hypothetical protein
LAFRFAPAFSVAEQASVRVSVSPRVFARVLRYSVFPAVVLWTSVPVDWRVSLPDESLASTLVWPQAAVSRQAVVPPVGVLMAADSLAGELPVGVLVAAVWLPAAVAFPAGDSYFVPEWPPDDSVGVLRVPADLAQCPAALRLCVHPPVDFPLDGSAAHDSLPDDFRWPALELLRAQE